MWEEQHVAIMSLEKFLFCEAPCSFLLLQYDEYYAPFSTNNNV